MKFLANIFGLGFNPLYVIIIAALLFAAGAGVGGATGWKLQGWKMGAELATERGDKKALQLTNDTLKGANDRCTVNVAAVQTAVQGVVNNANDLNNKAVAAMNRAAGKADEHQRKAEAALNRKPVPEAEWCPALQKEATAYAAARRGLRMDMNLKGKP